MKLPLMPKASAVWLVENTALTFEQIAAFCGMHALEVQGIADGEVAIGIAGLDPVANGQLTREELARCEADKSARLQLLDTSLPAPVVRTKGARYTPVSKRQERPSAIAWLLRHHGDLSDAQIGRLVGTTKSTIDKVRDRTHWDMQNIKPQSPVTLGLCSQEQLDSALDRINRAAQRAHDKTARDERRRHRDAGKAAAAAAAGPAMAEMPAEPGSSEPADS